MDVKDIATDKVIPYARNPRRNDAAVSAVAASIREFGFRQPIVVDEEMTVLVGHTRLKAAQSLGLAKVPVHIAKGLSKSQRKAYRIADNKLNDLAVWDDEMLALELVDLQNASYDLTLTGFDEEEIKKLEAMANATTEGLTDPDDVPDVDTTETRTKLGDIWLLGKHRVMCGDSTVANDVAGLMAGAKAGAVVTDPPYGIGSLMQGGTWATKQYAQLEMMRQWDATTSQKFFDMIASQEIPSVVWGGNYFATPPSRCWLAWDKPEFPSMSSVELAWTNMDLNSKRIECPRTHQVDGAKVHATQKPVRVMAWSLEFVPEGSVYDPFLGSGTTLIAAETTGRICYGMEICPQYVDVTVKRWEMFTGKTAFKLEAHT